MLIATIKLETYSMIIALPVKVFSRHLVDQIKLMVALTQVFQQLHSVLEMANQQSLTALDLKTVVLVVISDRAIDFPASSKKHLKQLSRLNHDKTVS